MSKSKMKYEKTPIKATDWKVIAKKEAEKLDTLTLLGMIVYRHRVGLLIVSNVVLLSLYLMPFLPDLLWR